MLDAAVVVVLVLGIETRVSDVAGFAEVIPVVLLMATLRLCTLLLRLTVDGVVVAEPDMLPELEVADDDGMD